MSLLDNTGWDRIAGRVGHLPAGPVARRAGFEMRLSDRAPAADFIVALATRGELFPTIAIGRRPARRAVRRALACSGRNQRPSRRLALAAGVTLEYDIAAVPAGSRPPPGVFLGLKPGFVAGTRVGGRPAAEVIAEAVADAVGWDRDPKGGQVLASLVASMPPQAELMQVGAMPGRGPRLLRITVIFARARGSRISSPGSGGPARGRRWIRFSPGWRTPLP